MTATKPPSLRSRDRTLGLYLILPALLILLLVFAYPMLRAIWLGFFHQNLGTRLNPVFAGWDNYLRILGDGRFWQSFWTTTRFTVMTVLLELIIGTAIALVLHQNFPGRGVVRTIAILPWALPTSLIALGWTWIFNDEFGLANDLLLRSGLLQQGLNWLGNPVTATLALIIADVWKTTPFISILLLAGLQSIPNDLYEAYSLEGASPWQQFTRITLPLLLPQIVIATLFRFAQAFGIFDLVQVMTGGGPGGSTEVVSLYIYANAMRYLDFGYASALVVVTFLLLVLGILVGATVLSRSRGVES